RQCGREWPFAEPLAVQEWALVEPGETRSHFAPENSRARLSEASNFRVYTRRMNTQTETETETEIPNQASAYNLDHVSNSELHLSTRRLVGRSNQILAALLAHLGEIEARGIHRERACASLHTYLVYELRLSEDAAFRRGRAARLCREFPVILEHIAAGEIHLTALLLLGPHLTEANHRELLAR